MFTNLRWHLLALIIPLFASPTAVSANHGAGDEPYCREYTEQVIIGGKREEAYGIACMQPDGSWQKVSNEGEPITQQQARLDPQRVIIHEERVYVPPVYRRRVYEPSFSLIIGDGWNRNRGWRWNHRHRDRHYGYNDHHHGRGHYRHSDRRGKHRKYRD